MLWCGSVNHSDVAVLVGAVGGLLVAFLLTAVRGEQFDLED